jgi:hypothetical protein
MMPGSSFCGGRTLNYTGVEVLLYLCGRFLSRHGYDGAGPPHNFFGLHDVSEATSLEGALGI